MNLSDRLRGILRTPCTASAAAGLHPHVSLHAAGLSVGEGHEVGEVVEGERGDGVQAHEYSPEFTAVVADTTAGAVSDVTTGKQFIQIMTELGLVEVSRTGIAAIGRGPASL